MGIAQKNKISVRIIGRRSWSFVCKPPIKHTDICRFVTGSLRRRLIGNRSPTQLGSDVRQFLPNAELSPSSARFDFSERLLSSSMLFEILFYIILQQKASNVKVFLLIFEKFMRADLQYRRSDVRFFPNRGKGQ